MAKKNYRLQSVLNAHERVKQERARVVALRRTQLADAETELERREAEVARCREQQTDVQARMMEESRTGTGVAQMLSYRTHLADLRAKEQELNASVAQQQAVVARCEAEVEEALAALAEAAREVQVIEKHREHWREDERREGQRREQKLNDEIAAIIHERRSSD